MMTKTARTKLRKKLQTTYGYTSIQARNIMARLLDELNTYRNGNVINVDVVSLNDNGEICNDYDNLSVTRAIIGYTAEWQFRVLGNPGNWMEGPARQD